MEVSQHNDQDDLLIFSEENEVSGVVTEKKEASLFNNLNNQQNNTIIPASEQWKILVVDDDKSIHDMTTMVLSDFIFENKNLNLLHAYSAFEAKKILSSDNDIAVVLLDVVMETDDAGLTVAKFIRDNLKNDIIQIIIRTAQPGAAPEKEVIIKYNINDYKSKTELTFLKMFTIITTGLRAYQLSRELKNAKEYYRKAKEAAESASKAKSSFLSIISHEMRTPLNSLLGMAKMLSETPLNNEQSTYIKILMNSGDQILDMINNVLDLVHIESEHFVLESNSFDLKKQINAIYEKMLPKAHAKTLGFNCSISDELPAFVTGDAFRLGQILLYIVDNAIKFTYRGHVELHANVLKLSGNHLEMQIVVSDTGIGIAKENQEKIFDLFTCLEASDTRRYGGVGIGLGFCKKLVEIMGGNITVKSEYGKGSQFFITLPFSVLDNKTLSPQTNIPDSDKSIHDPAIKRPLKILLVEDNPNNQMVFSIFLDDTNHEIDIAENGKEGLEKFIADHYDIVFMDIQMPIMDGYESTTKIREWENQNKLRPKPIIAVTAHGEKNKTLLAGCSDYLAKPLDKDALINCIQKFGYN